MTEKKTYNDEINLAEIIQTILNGKKKIIITLIISIFIAIVISARQPPLPPKIIISTTEIKPLNDGQINNFELINSLNIYNIDSDKLYKNFLDTLEKRTVLKKAIKKFGIISKENYSKNSIPSFEDAVSIESYKMIIITDSALALKNYIRGKITKDELTFKSKKDSSFIILQNTHKDNLYKLLGYIKKENNRLAILDLETEFKKRVSILRELNRSEKKEVLVKIEELKKEFDISVAKQSQSHKFRLEDIEIEIQNLIVDNKLEMTQQLKDIEAQSKNIHNIKLLSEKKRLQYLTEQALIARKVKISKPNIEGLTQTINQTTDEEDWDSDQIDIPYYLRGYEAIEEEIRIIKDRKNKNILENEERSVKEDRIRYNYRILKNKTMNKLLDEKRNLKQIKIAERKDQKKLYLNGILRLERELLAKDRNEKSYQKAENLFKENLIKFSDDFESVIFDPNSTTFETKPINSFHYPSFTKILVVAIFLGLMLSMLYVIIEKKIKNILSSREV